MNHDASDAPLGARLRPKPRAGDAAVADARFAELLDAVDPSARAVLSASRVRRLIRAVADQSPYLWHLARGDPRRLVRVLGERPERAVAAALARLAAGDLDETEASLMRRLRLAKQEVALIVALADLGGAWRLETVLRTLSSAADALIGAALGFLLRRAEASGKLPSAAMPGLVLVGLGKLGGRELNYSSDVDLVAIHDPAAAGLDPDAAGALFVRLVKDLVRLLQTRTADGYALRVDLRLRPDPGATAVAMRIGAAMDYYETHGQNWERAAMIKARVVAGDPRVGQAFIAGLAPFIWRKYFDYAAIADIHAMKRQIHAAKGHGAIAVAGHDVKLGRGGIREIEFFVQTQQLIFGGKRPALRGSRTIDMLRRLGRDGSVGRAAVGDLARAYRFLRDIEHRLQMVADAQTHRLPLDPATLERFARFAGFASAASFSRVLTRHFARVVAHYALLFEHAPGLDDAGGSLVFTGVADDPETIETLAALGYRAPEVVSRMVRDWHSGRKPATRSPRARETLTDLVPKLLRAFAMTSDPDGAVAVFDGALDRMPAAAELFAILLANAGLRRLFGDMLGSAPRLARAVARRPHLLDAAIDPTALAMLDDAATTAAAPAVDAPTEAFLDAVRDWANEEHFLIGLRLLSGTLDPDDAGRAYSALAVGVIRATLAHARRVFAAEHGVVPGAAMAVLAMGKLGSREMTAASDLDLVVLYDFDPDRPESDGPRPLHATRYFTRLTQRLVSHLTVATRRGALYAVDMRLRPSGRQGPLATKLGAFAPYQRAEAETWEHMALTRARVVAGDARFGAEVTGVVASILRAPPGPTLRADVAAMRALLAREKPPVSAWDLKHVAGGLLDIEFAAQYLVLRHAAAAPAILDPATRGMLAGAAKLGVLDPEAAATLDAAHRLYTHTLQILRLALDEGQAPEQAGEGVRARLAAASGLPSFDRLIAEIVASRQAVAENFAALFSSA